MTQKERRLAELESLREMTRDEVATFWETHDPADYWDLMPDGRVKKSPKVAMSFKLDQADIDQLKRLADEKGIGATTLVRMIIRAFLHDPDKIPIP